MVQQACEMYKYQPFLSSNAHHPTQLTNVQHIITPLPLPLQTLCQCVSPAPLALAYS